MFLDVKTFDYADHVVALTFYISPVLKCQVKRKNKQNITKQYVRHLFFFLHFFIFSNKQQRIFSFHQLQSQPSLAVGIGCPVSGTSPSLKSVRFVCSNNV